MYDLIDQVIPFAFSLSFIAMLLLMRKVLQRMKSGVKGVGGTQYTMPYPVFAALLFMGSLFAVMALSMVLKAEARKEIEVWFSFADMPTLTIEINGKPVSNTAAVLNVLEEKQRIPAQHSHPVNRIFVTLHDRHGALVLRLGRDSTEKNEYWVFYPRYHSTDHNEVYRISTDIFDKY